MLKNSVLPIFLISLGFTAGVGFSHWDKVEKVNLVFYTIILGLTLVGIVIAAFEYWRYWHHYRRAANQQHENYSRISAAPVRTPALPKLEELPAHALDLNDVETLFIS